MCIVTSGSKVLGFMKSKHYKSYSLKTILIFIIILLFFSCDDFSFYSLWNDDGLIINPEEISLYTSTGCTFSAIDGSPPYFFSILSGLGSINSDTGAYTAPNEASTDIVLLTDSGGDTATATVTISVNIGGVAINPQSITINISTTYPFTAFGGTAPYKFYMQSGPGTIDPDTGLYTAPDYRDNNVYVYVEDGVGGTATARIKVKNL